MHKRNFNLYGHKSGLESPISPGGARASVQVQVDKHIMPTVPALLPGAPRPPSHSLGPNAKVAARLYLAGQAGKQGVAGLSNKALERGADELFSRACKRLPKA